MAIRIDNPLEVGADRLVNAIAAYERFGGACIVVDFGTGINFDAVSADGDYLGGAIGPGLEISLTALIERAARIAAIDLDEPETAIGRSSRAAIQSGFVFGFAGMIDGIVRRIEDELGDADLIATGGLARVDRPLHRDDRRGRRHAYPEGPASHPCAQLLNRHGPPSPTHSRSAAVRIANRVLLAPLAGIGNWFVRLQAKRHGAGLAVSEMVSSFGLHHRNERTLRELLRIHPDEHPVSIQLFGHDPEVMRSGSGDRRRGRRRPDRHQHGLPGAQGAQDRRRGRAARRPRARPRPGPRRGGGQRAAGDREAALRPAAPATAPASSWRVRLVEEAGVAAIGFHPRAATVSTRAAPTTR